MPAANILPLLLAILSLPFADWQIWIGPVPFYPPEFFVVFALVALVWHKRYEDTPATIKTLPRFILPMLLILVGLAFSIAFSDHSRTGLGILKAWFIFPLLFSWLLVRSVQSLKHLSLILWTWYSTTLGITLVGWKYILNGSFTYDGRLQATFTSPNFLAMMLLPGVFFGLYFLRNMRFKNQKYSFLLLSFSWALITTAFYSTFSYAAWMSALFGLGVAHSWRNPRNARLILSTAAMLAIILLFLFSSQLHTEKFQNILHGYERSSLASRLMIWRSAASMLADHPLVGIGPGNFQNTYLDYQRFFPPYLEWAVPQPHNLYLAFWLQAGIAGLIGFLWLTVSWMRMLSVSARTTKQAPLCATLLGIMTAILIHGLFDTPYWKTDLAYTFWLLIALGNVASSDIFSQKSKRK